MSRWLLFSRTLTLESPFCVLRCQRMPARGGTPGTAPRPGGRFLQVPSEACRPGFGVCLSPNVPSPTECAPRNILDTQTLPGTRFWGSPSGSWGTPPVQRLQLKGPPRSRSHSRLLICFKDDLERRGAGV